MKKNLLTITLVMFFSQLLPAQQQKANPDFYGSAMVRQKTTFSHALLFVDTTFTKDYYWEKSRNQRTVAWFMLGGGVALSIVGVIGASQTLFDENNAADTYGVIALAGIGLSLGSIPVFMASGRNARKAATLSFKNQNILFPGQNSFVRKAQPTISIDISL